MHASFGYSIRNKGGETVSDFASSYDQLWQTRIQKVGWGLT